MGKGRLSNYEHNDIGQLTAGVAEEIDTIEWTVTGKVKKIVRSSGSTKEELEFLYDPMGNRIAKIVKPRTGGTLTDENDWTYTYYTKDAQGNTIGKYDKTYSVDGSELTETYVLKELDIYSSSRVGLISENDTIGERVSHPVDDPSTSTWYTSEGYLYDTDTLNNEPAAVLVYEDDPSDTLFDVVVGKRKYEFSNHLGNVLEVTTDKKVVVEKTVDYLCFDYANAEYADYSSFTAGLSDELTLELWFKTSTATSGPLLQYMESGVNGKGAKITISGGVLSASGLNGSGTASLTGTTSVDDDNWHHVALTGHDTDFKLYLDGELEDSETIASGNFTGMTETFYVAGDGINGFFNGCMKEVSFWDAEKSSTDIWADFSGETEFAGSESGLIGYWKLDEGTGTTADDETSNNRDLTLNNTPTWTDGEYVDYNTADVIAFNDYYPFGQILDSRHSNSNSYRYGFNGKEKDDEAYGEGNIYNYGFRIYNPRLGKFLSMDPLMDSYPWYTPYQFAGNKPIVAMDLDGLEEFIAIDKGKQYTLIWDIKARKRGEGGTIQYVSSDHEIIQDTRKLNSKELANDYIKKRLEMESGVDYDEDGAEGYPTTIVISPSTGDRVGERYYDKTELDVHKPKNPNKDKSRKLPELTESPTETKEIEVVVPFWNVLDKKGTDIPIDKDNRSYTPAQKSHIIKTSISSIRSTIKQAGGTVEEITINFYIPKSKITEKVVSTLQELYPDAQIKSSHSINKKRGNSFLYEGEVKSKKTKVVKTSNND